MERSVASAARVLVVDDEPSYRMYLASSLRSCGYVIHTAACASEALAVWESEGGFELVVTDLKLPDMDGLKLRDELLRRRPGARVLVLSAGSNRPGVQDKPVTRQDLFDAIEAALVRRPRASDAPPAKDDS